MKLQGKLEKFDVFNNTTQHIKKKERVKLFDVLSWINVENCCPKKFNAVNSTFNLNY